MRNLLLLLLLLDPPLYTPAHWRFYENALYKSTTYLLTYLNELMTQPSSLLDLSPCRSRLSLDSLPRRRTRCRWRLSFDRFCSTYHNSRVVSAGLVDHRPISPPRLQTVNSYSAEVGCCNKSVDFLLRRYAMFILSVCLSVCPICLPVHGPIRLSVCLSVCPSRYLFIYL